jgi:O-antigen/teichoic acid export membrane protein
MSDAGRRSRLVRMFSSAVVNQALLSGASLAVSLVLIRRTSDSQYGYYVLVLAALLLITSLQNAFYGPAMVSRLTRFNREQRSDLIGGLYREQRQVWLGMAAIAVVATLVAYLLHRLDNQTGPLVLVAILAALPALRREYFRSVLLAHRQSENVLKSDVAYVILLISGAFAATFSPFPAITAVFTLALAAIVGGALLAGTLDRHEPLNPSGAPGILREIAPLALWSTGGAVIHWSFSQGYSFLVAGTLDIAAVAAVGAIRLLLMPVNLLSTGIGSLMLPLASRWLHDHGTKIAFSRLCLFAAALSGVALAYFGVLWLLRDWIFAAVLKKQFADRDRLLLLWGVASILMVIRDQVVFLPITRERFRTLTALTLLSAVVALSISYVGMLKFGVIGALIGVLSGECINVFGLIWLSLREVAQDDRRTTNISPM